MKILAAASLLFLILSSLGCSVLGLGGTPKAKIVKLSLTMNPHCLDGNGPSGAGTIALTPPPQSSSGTCALTGDNPVTCDAGYTQGAIVTLTAAPDPRPGPDGKPIATFEAFDGIDGCAKGATSCHLTMDGDKQVTAVFCSRVF